jgi:hypothetical protein
LNIKAHNCHFSVFCLFAMSAVLTQSSNASYIAKVAALLSLEISEWSLRRATLGLTVPSISSIASRTVFRLESHRMFTVYSFNLSAIYNILELRSTFHTIKHRFCLKPSCKFRARCFVSESRILISNLDRLASSSPGCSISQQLSMTTTL